MITTNGNNSCNIHMFIQSLVKTNIQKRMRKKLSLSDPFFFSFKCEGRGWAGFAVGSLVATCSEVCTGSFVNPVSLGVIFLGGVMLVPVILIGKLVGFFKSASEIQYQYIKF